ncbi:NADPH:quinone oxidoreductase [Pseudooceanicola nanhaiensis]|jgi:NADPH:quinone reductase-like Zn-dependent oxidoreductase|uniref:NADPH:quinone oxidoreductase n=1 Tax=Pseudooceanicola nanhaiensis TaxID=375761 RepID=A0A917WFC5_9RHOB|nr:NADPH:quinone oxidoreductase family protein [Pseudooceanicola nanhaiensis]GGL99668.1 NADPH:quinone oxidoreductase [Pseudooceanicola nanhaiensis]
MKAIVCNEFGPLSDLEYKDLPDPEAGPGQVLIKVEACGVNYPDGLLVQGKYQVRPDRPFIPGSEVAGEIVALGEGVTDREVGQRVVGYAGQTGYASMAAIPAASTFLLPEGADAAEACALIIAYGTSHHALKQRAQLKPGETLVVFGAAGATGVAAVQIGKIMGATVIAVVSSEEKGKIAKECGADHVIGYDGLKDKVKELTGGKGADVCYDVVGGEAFDAASRFMARNGRLLVIGFASGDIPKFPVNLALVKEYAVVGVFWGNFTRAEPQVYAENMRELLDWFGSRTVKPIVAGRFPLKDAAEVLETVLGRGGVGKFALIPEGV